MVITIIFVLSILSNLILLYGVRNLIKKCEAYEEINAAYENYIMRFYEKAVDILRTARELDSKQMFEKDDEVGTLFQDLIAVIGEFREVIYGGINNDSKFTNPTPTE